MARRNGWQMPAHGFQITAITAFFLLSIAFYAFFAPFLGNNRYIYAATGVYSFFAFSVLVLYARCAAVDPADPGIAIHIDKAQACKSPFKIQQSKESSHSISKSGNTCLEHSSSTCLGITGSCCACLVMEDCRGEEISTQKQSNNDESLFCTLCNAEVNKFSKHCRSCDKCVLGFDHHCRWLNNCVGRRNYFTFLSLMTMSLFWLIVETAIGVAVLVRCFTHKEAMEIVIKEKLGNIFSQAPFAAVVAVCTAFCMLACIPLGELFFFHMLLIRKGMTTYDYIVAMRAQSEQGEPSVREDQSLRSSPFSSALTAVSRGSSIGLQYRGAWCTPPRIFVDQQDEMVAHPERGYLPSALDAENVLAVEKAKRAARQPVGLSAWKLAKLDSAEAAKAAAKARASSSVLRPINSYHAERSKSGGSGAWDSDVAHRMKGTVRCPSPSKSARPPNSAGREDVSEEWPETPSDFSSSPAQVTPHTTTTTHFNPVYQMWTNGSPVPSSTQTNDEDDGESQRKQVGAATGWSVYWDRHAGRFVGALDPTAAGATELMCTGQSIFFGGPLLNVGTTTSTATVGPATERQGTADGRRGSSRPPRKDRFHGIP